MANRATRILLSLFLFGLSSSVLYIRTEPIDSYTLDIYADPWAGMLILALIVAGTIAYVTIDPTYETPFLGIGIVAIWLILSFPLIRGYFYYGTGDPLSHLGFLRMIIDTGSVDLIYPSKFTMSAFTVLLTDRSLRFGLLLSSSVLMIPWLIFLPLSARITYRGSLPVLGWVVPWSILLITPISTFPRPHPATEALFLSPLILYVYLRGLRSGIFQVFFGIVYLFSLLLHPLIAVSMLFLLVTHLAISWWISEVRKPRMLFILFGAAVVSWAWIQSTRAFTIIVATTTVKIVYSGVATGGGASSRVSSLTAVGVNPVYYGAKVGFKYVVFGLLGGLSVLFAAYRRDRSKLALAFSSISLVVLTGVFVASGKLNIWTRAFALLMILVTIFAIHGVARYFPSSAGTTPDRRYIIGLVVIVGVLSAILTIHPSPYTLQPNNQVSEATYDGYETSFAYQKPGIRRTETRPRSFRYAQAIYGFSFGTTTRDVSRYESDKIPDHFRDRRLGEDTEPKYLTITRADFVTDARLYGGFRYTSGDFAYLRTEPAVQRVVDSGGLTNYYVRANASEENETMSGP